MLNDQLFGALERYFGSGNVLVVNEDVPMSAAYQRDPLDTKGKSKTRLVVNDSGSGEEYRVSCPFCNETRNRLYINHRWGLFDPETNTRNLWLAQCWNEECLTDFDRQKSLYDRLLEFYGGFSRNVGLGRKASSAPNVKMTGPINMPGPVWYVHDMLRRSPRHPVITYLRDKLFEPAYLGSVFQVCYCPDSHHPWAHNRIIAPVIMHNKLVGWQARCIGDPPSKQIPKWFTCPGMNRGRAFYNFDLGIRYQTKVIVEGPPDVWGHGQQSMGLLGKKMGPGQKQLLLDNCEPGDTVVILLDPQKSPDDVAKDRPHHIEVLYEQLNAEKKLKGHVLPVYLPGDYDPGELDKEYQRELIHAVAKERGIKVSFKRRV